MTDYKRWLSSVVVVLGLCVAAKQGTHVHSNSRPLGKRKELSFDQVGKEAMEIGKRLGVNDQGYITMYPDVMRSPKRGNENEVIAESDSKQNVFQYLMVVDAYTGELRSLNTKSPKPKWKAKYALRQAEALNSALGWMQKLGIKAIPGNRIRQAEITRNHNSWVFQWRLPSNSTEVAIDGLSGELMSVRVMPNHA